MSEHLDFHPVPEQENTMSGLLLSVEPLESVKQPPILLFVDDESDTEPPDTDSDDTNPGTDQDMDDGDADGTDDAG